VDFRGQISQDFHGARSRPRNAIIGGGTADVLTRFKSGARKHIGTGASHHERERFWHDRALGRPCCSDNPQTGLRAMSNRKNQSHEIPLRLHRPRRTLFTPVRRRSSISRQPPSSRSLRPLLLLTEPNTVSHLRPPLRSLAGPHSSSACRASLTKGSRRPQAPICRAWPRQCSRRRPAAQPRNRQPCCSPLRSISRTGTRRSRETFEKTGTTKPSSQESKAD